MTTINLKFWNGNPPDYGGVTMPRLPAVSSSYTEPRVTWPFVMCLSPQSCRRLWGTDTPPEIKRVDIMDFDPAYEVSRAPESENHMRAT